MNEEIVPGAPHATGNNPGAQRLRALSSQLPAIFFTLFLAAGLILVLNVSIPSGPAPLRVGDVAKESVRSPQRVSYVSQIKTRQAKDAAASAIFDIYDYDPGVAQQQRAQAQVLFNGIANIRADSTVTADQKKEAIQRLADGIVLATTAKSILSVGDSAWPQVVTETNRVLDEVMRDRVRQTDLPLIRAKLPSRFSQDLNSELLPAAVAIVSDLIKPNEILNVAETAKQKKEAQDKVEPVRETVEKGEVVVREGNVVGALDLEKLEAVGLQQARIDWKDAASAALLVLLVVAVLIRYLQYFQPRVLHGGLRSLLLAAGILLLILAARLASSERAMVGVTWVYIVPFAALPMLVGMLVDQQLAIVTSVLVGILAGYTSGHLLDVGVMVTIGGFVGALRTHRVERLSAFLWAGIIVALANAVVVVTFFLSSPDYEPTALTTAAVLAAAGGVLSAAITAVTFAPLGSIVGATTVLHLLELAHPSQPLFRRLLLEAPGTYHHSVMISTLGERAAETVGADALLVRVGAYYHDIGKVARPYLYIENQINGTNVHDTLDPLTSARAIISHVQEGIDLARKHHLPQAIIDMIPQHHGTKLVGFFYARARSQGLPLNEADYRYPGPKPQTKEAAILMLADGVEAAVRASRDHSQDVIEHIVADIVAAQVADGQLTECDLTLKDLDRIRAAFASVLQGVYHPRIAYPPAPGMSMAPVNDTPGDVASAPAVPITPAQQPEGVT